MIRRATPADAPAVAQLWNWMIVETLATFTTVEKTPSEIAMLIEVRKDAFWIAEKGGDLAGFATFGPFRSGPGYAATGEHTVIVSPHSQGAGVGRALLTHLEGAAAAQGCHVMIAAISSANAPALAFHRSMGYRETGRMPEVGRKAGQWLDLILMQKILPTGA